MSAILFTIGLTLGAPAQEPGAPSQLDEVVANVRRQPLGSGTVDDLALPEDLLRRLSDRILRRSYEEHFRIVVEDPPAARGAPGAATPADEAPAEAADERSLFRVVLDVLALAALGVLLVLGFFAWRARARRKS